jgi:hypothetical protein
MVLSIRVRRYLRGEISGVRQYERFVPMKQVVSTGWWSRSVSARTACTCSPVRTLSSKLLYLRFVFARFIQGLQLVFIQLVVVVHVISYLGFCVWCLCSMSIMAAP